MTNSHPLGAVSELLLCARPCAECCPVTPGGAAGSRSWPSQPPCEKWTLWCPTSWSSAWGLRAIKHKFRVAQGSWRGPSGEQPIFLWYYFIRGNGLRAVKQISQGFGAPSACLQSPGFSSSPALSWHPPTWSWFLRLPSFKAMWCWLRNPGELQEEHSKPVLRENDGRNVLE